MSELKTVSTDEKVIRWFGGFLSWEVYQLDTDLQNSSLRNLTLANPPSHTLTHSAHQPLYDYPGLNAKHGEQKDVEKRAAKIHEMAKTREREKPTKL